MTLSCDDLVLNEDPQFVRGATNPNQIGNRKMGPVQMRANGNVRIDGQSEKEGRFGRKPNRRVTTSRKSCLCWKAATGRRRRCGAARAEQ